MADVVAETKGQRTRRRLLELAVRRFAEDGYRATSVSAIAREAGVTQAAVYAYFASKEALFEAAVDLDAAELIAEARAELDESMPLADLIPTLLLVLRVGLDRHPLAQRVLAGREPDVIARLIDLPALQEITSDFTELLREAERRGELRPGVDPDLLGTGIETMVLSLMMSSLQVGEAADTRAEAIVAVFRQLLG